MTKDEIIATLLSDGLIDEAEADVLRRSTPEEVAQTDEELRADYERAERHIEESR